MIKIFYHRDCIDGNACIWVMRKFLAETPFTPIGIDFGSDYETAIFSNVNNGDTVYFLDFSPTHKVIDTILPIAEKIYIIDHHVYDSTICHDKVISYINENHCAAYNVFKYLYPNREIPNIIKYIDVTDLINTKAMNYYEIAAFVRTLQEEGLEESLNDLERYQDIDVDSVIKIGKEVFKQDYLKMEEELGEIYYREIEIERDKKILFPIVHANIYEMGAEIDYKLKQLLENPNPNGEIPHMSCAYFHDDYFIRLNIRTNPQYLDASFIASYIGHTFGLAPGGGHRNAAVARFSPEQFKKLFNIDV